MSRNAVLEDKAGNQVLPITKGENVYYDANNTMNDKVNALSNSIAVNSARIDTFTNLEEGSTTGDAELIDARVDYFGIVHETAGDAMRSILSFLFNGYIDVSNLVQLDSAQEDGDDFVAGNLKNITLPVTSGNGSVEIILPPHSSIHMWAYSAGASPTDLHYGDLDATSEQTFTIYVGSGGIGTGYQQIELFGQKPTYANIQSVIELVQLKVYKPRPSEE